MRSKAAALAIAPVMLTSCASPPATATVQVGTARYRVEVATTHEAQRRGLAGRSISPGTGMLFPLPSRPTQQVWAAGMTQAIDVVWIDAGTVRSVAYLSPCTQPNQDLCPRLSSPGPVDAVLEVPAGSGITTGQTVTIT